MEKKGFFRLTSIFLAAAIFFGGIYAFAPRAEEAEEAEGLADSGKGTVIAAVNPNNQITPLKVNLAEDLGAKTENSVILYLNSPVAYVKNAQTFVDPLNANAAPIVENGRVLVPLQFIAEGFGAKYSWDEKTQTAKIEIDNKTITCKVGENSLYIDGIAVKMDTSAKIIDGRAFVPLRAFADAIGKEVFYDNGLIIISNTKNIYDPKADKPTLDNIISKLNNLPIIGTKEKFIELAGKPDEGYNFRMYDGAMMLESGMAVNESMKEMDGGAPIPAPAAAAEPQSTQGPTGGAGSDDFSTTNVQVQGVDEADIIKTDGTYIYYMKQQNLCVVKAVPADEMKLEYSIEFDNNNFSPSEIYLDGNTLVVIGQFYEEMQKIYDNIVDTVLDRNYYYNPKPVSRAIVYDITDKQNVKKVREVDTDGYYVSSRKVDKAVYIVTNLPSYSLVYKNDYVLPQYRDTAIQDNCISIGYDRMYFYPERADNNFTIVTGFEIDTPANKAEVNTYFGGGTNIYATKDSLYVATVNYYYNIMPLASDADIDIARSSAMIKPYNDTPSTVVYKFKLDKGSVSYDCKGSVPGAILNQFSMDESDGYFRIATTSNDKNYNPTNNLYVLDKTMSIVGKIENIAPDERIYSVRFMGNRAYMVTFRTVDPLFVIDLKDPRNPKILGELKIPGYSDYLHPYDETHLIGFGKDAVAVNGNAYYLGVKISMFDVSDVSNPKEMFSEIIGDRGTESELLRNHKALLFSKEKGLLAFPITVCELDPRQKIQPWSYGEPVFQGAYVYSVDLENGFSKKGEITHTASGDLYNYRNDKFIQRIIYIGDTLYTVSNNLLKSTSFSNMKDLGMVDLK